MQLILVGDAPYLVPRQSLEKSSITAPCYTSCNDGIDLLTRWSGAPLTRSTSRTASDVVICAPVEAAGAGVDADASTADVSSVFRKKERPFHLFKRRRVPATMIGCAGTPLVSSRGRHGPVESIFEVPQATDESAALDHHTIDEWGFAEADPDGGAGGARPTSRKKKKKVDLLLRACTWHAAGECTRAAVGQRSY